MKQKLKHFGPEEDQEASNLADKSEPQGIYARGRSDVGCCGLLKCACLGLLKAASTG